MAPNRHRAVPIGCVAFLSGAAALVHQVVWLRLLARSLGSTSLATATVLGVFLAGLSLGAAFAAGGRRLRARPRRLFGQMEIGAGLGALLLLLVVETASPELARLGASTGGSLLRWGLVALLVLIPTLCMGASFPALVQLASARERSGETTGGWIYAWNTLGAGGGALLTTFLLLPALGFTVAALGAVAVEAGLGAWALVGARRGELAAVEEATAGSRGPDTGTVLRDPRLLSLVVLVSGAVTLAVEVVWVRAMGLLLGSSAYVVGTVVAVTVLGLGVGAAVASRPGSRGADPGRRILNSLVAAAWCLWVDLLLVPRVPGMVAASGWEDLGGALRVACLLAMAVVLALPASLALGGVFPLALRLWTRGPSDAGEKAGWAYAASASGSLFGAMAAALFLVPALGLRGSLAAAGLLLAATAAAAAFTGRGRRAPRLLVAAALAGVVLLLPWPRWPAERIASGAWLYGRSAVDGRVLFHRDGREATVTVVENGPWLEMRVNGKVDASTRRDLETQIFLGHLGAVLHPEPRRVLLLGLGSGITAASLLAHDEVESLTVAEVEPAVLPASRYFRAWNRGALGDPRLHMEVTDGRALMARSPSRWDLIVSEPSNPWVVGMADLFTREAFEAGRAALRPGGVYLQWVQGYRLAPDDFRAVLRTFHAVFPEASLWVAGRALGDLVLVGGEAHLDLGRIEGLLRGGGPGAEDLERAGIRRPVDLPARLLAKGPELEALAGKGPLLRDDHPWLEYTAPLALHDESHYPAVLALLRRHRTPPDAWGGFSPTDFRELRRLHQSRGIVLGALAEAPELEIDGYIERLEHALAVEPRDADAARFLSRALTDRGLLLLERGARAEARRVLERAVAVDPRHPKPLLTLALLAEEAGQPRRAGELYARYNDAYPYDPAAWRRLAAARRALGDEEGAALAEQRSRAVDPDPRR